MTRRSSLAPALAVLAACSYYDNGLLKFSPDDPVGAGAGGSAGAAAGTAGASGAQAGRSGQAGANEGGAGGLGGSAQGGAGVGGTSGGSAGTAGSAGSGAGGGNAGNAGSASGGAGTSGGNAGGGGSPLACNRVTLPPRPVTAGGSGGGAGMSGSAGNAAAAGSSGAAGTGVGGSPAFPAEGLVFAMRTLDFNENQKPEESTLGFDLDGACTCLDTPVETCTTVKPRATLCDGPGGRDNSFPRLYKDLISFGFADSSTAISQDIDAGRYTILLRIQNYNGLPEDDEVKLSFYVGGECTSPQWTGGDPWTVLSTSVIDGDLEKPRVKDLSAYVTGGVLVASIPTFDEKDDRVIVQLNDKFAVALTGAVIVAKLDSFLDRWRITEGTLSGRWRDKDFFEYFSTFRGALEEPTKCTDSLFYPQIKSTFCGYADVSGSLGDVTGACTAMSIATRFTAQVAQLGTIQQVPTTPPSTCPPATNPATDSCSK